MPKERVSDDGAFAVEIGWHPERDVQIGVLVGRENGPSLARALWGNQCREIGAAIREMQSVLATDSEITDSDTLDARLGAQLLEYLDLAIGVGGPCAGVWATLERHECNHAVRQLRRARDSAYGKDE